MHAFLVEKSYVKWRETGANVGIVEKRPLNHMEKSQKRLVKD
jgi:hypothetical protein